MPQLNSLLNQYHRQGFDVVSINLDGPEDQTAAGNYWKQQNYRIHGALMGLKVSDDYKVEVFPANYLVDKNGKVLARYVGYNGILIRMVLFKAGFK